MGDSTNDIVNVVFVRSLFVEGVFKGQSAEGFGRLRRNGVTEWFFKLIDAWQEHCEATFAPHKLGGSDLEFGTSDQAEDWLQEGVYFLLKDDCEDPDDKDDVVIWFRKVLDIDIPNSVALAAGEDLTHHQLWLRLKEYLEMHHENWLDDACEKFQKLFDVDLYHEPREFKEGFWEDDDVHALTNSGALFNDEEQFDNIQTTPLAALTINLAYWEKDKDWWTDNLKEENLNRPPTPFARAWNDAHDRQPVRYAGPSRTRYHEPLTRDQIREIAKSVFTWP